MANTVVVGAQWGDEAKGKVVDYLARSAEMVVRYGGGSNAGHTVEAEGETYKFHLVPCGILHENVVCVIADGVVVDPEVLVREIGDLEARGKPARNLRLSANAHVVMPYHIALDRLAEQSRGADALGTTCRGIGPAYADKSARTGIRMHELVEPERLEARAREQFSQKNRLIEELYGAEPIDADAAVSRLSELGERLRPYVCDTVSLVGKAAMNGAGVVFEGAQGTLLDLDLGTYPYVTSSHPVAGGACLGTGVGPTRIDGVLGVAKSYTTRVGAGVFPTELLDATGDLIRERGREYGTTTGRPRRCGWLDTVVLRYSAMVNGLTGLALGHLDVLSGFDQVRVCTAYRIGGQLAKDLPIDLCHVDDLEPVYETLPGWSEELAGIRRASDLPSSCRAYIRFVEEMAGVAVTFVSVGPAREQLLPV